MTGVQRLIGARNAVSIATLVMMVASLLAVGPAVDPAEAAPTPQFRALDTRNDPKPGDGAILCPFVVDANQLRNGVTAVGVNIAAVQPNDEGFLKAYRSGGIGPPETSTLNYSPALGNISNNAIVEVGPNGRICVFASRSTHIVVDVNNVFYEESYIGVRPFRARDTRGGEAPGRGFETCVTVAGVGGIPSDASSVAINVTAVAAQDRGYLSVYPSGAARPFTSNLNYAPGRNISNGNIVAVGREGEICVFNSEATHHVVDVTGWFRAFEDVSALASPQRLYDSRRTARLSPGSRTCVVVVGDGVPVSATSVFLNVTAVRPDADGFVTTYPKGSAVPNVSSLNYQAGDVRANGVMVQVGAAGRVCFLTDQGTDLVVDILAFEVFGPRGYVPPDAQVDVGTVLLRALSPREGACSGGPARTIRDGPVDWRDWVSRYEFSSLRSLSAFTQRIFFEVEAYHSILIRERCYQGRFVFEWVGRPSDHLERCAAYTTAFRLPPVDLESFNWSGGDWRQARSDTDPCPNNGSGNLTTTPTGEEPPGPTPTAEDPGEQDTLRRLSGDGRQQTAAAIAVHSFPQGADVVYIAEEGAGLAETLAAGTVTDGPVLLAAGGGTPGLELLEAIADLDPESVVALGPETAIDDTVLDNVSQGRPVDRVVGESVYATAAAIAERAWPEGADTVYLAEAVNLADGLAGGTITDGPILLVPADGDVPAAIVETVDALAPQRVVVLGGSVAVSDSVLADVANGRDTARLEGASRFETAAAVAQSTFPEGAGSVYLARADIAPDAVVAGSVTDGPILLVESCNRIHPATLAELDRLQPEQVVALGGDAAICDDTVLAAQPG